MNRLMGWARQLRPEECLALVAILPFIVLSLVADSAPTLHHVATTSYLMPLLFLVTVTWLGQHSTQATVRVVRDFLPFMFVVWMYENMHDVTTRLHLTDKHHWLITADEWLFGGVNPVLWMQRWVHPHLTDILAAAYASYYVLPPLLTLILYRRGQKRDFHDAIVAIVLTFYIGLIGYVAIPAMDPWITMRERFTVDLQGSPLTQEALNLFTMSRLKVARDCFPSLHAAVSLVALVFARRTGGVLFWCMLPCVVLLLVATVYLRLHYVVDLLAALPLAAFSIWAAPRMNDWWARGTSRQAP